MDFTKLDDEALLRQVGLSQADALSELYDRFGRLVFSVAYHITSSKEQSEEITQDTFLRVWQRAETYQAEWGKVSTWLASIARHRAIDLYRRGLSRHENLDNSYEEMPDFVFLDQTQVVEENLVFTQQREQVRQVLRQIPEEQRQVIALAYFRGLTQQEIAQSLSLPVGTVKTRIRLGLQKMRRLYQLLE